MKENNYLVGKNIYCASKHTMNSKGINTNFVRNIDFLQANFGLQEKEIKKKLNFDYQQVLFKENND